MERTEVRAVDLDSRKQQQAPAVADVMAISAANGTEYVAPSTRLRNVEPEGGKVREKWVYVTQREGRGTWHAEGLHEEVRRDDDRQHVQFVGFTVADRGMR